MHPQLALTLSALAFLFSLFSFIYLKSYIKRRTGKEHITSEIEEDVNKLVKTINEVTERDISLIEEREKNLKSLLQETEKRISVYVKEMDRFRDADAIYAQTVLWPQAQASPEETYQELGKNRYKLREEAAPAAEPEPAPADKLSVSEQIVLLVQAGYSFPAIASRLEISISEVEFAAALLERREAK